MGKRRLHGNANSRPTESTSVVVATFHTHPNPGSEYQQEPSLTDIRAVRDDWDLNHPDYEGEYVIATEHTYRIPKQGPVATIGETSVVLEIGGPGTAQPSGGSDVHTNT
jgi:proteasome lid subunit RPN8/RPN11